MSKKQDIGHGGINDCPRCHLHYVNPVKTEIDGKTQWRVICSNCYLAGPNADSPRFAIRKWNVGEGDVFEG